MDHEAICDCPFLARCETFADPLIDQRRKGPEGLGCQGQNDRYRGKHCKTFACAYLSMVLTDALKPTPTRPAGGG